MCRFLSDNVSTVVGFIFFVGCSRSVSTVNYENLAAHNAVSEMRMDKRNGG
jgi:hypothetical protein